MYNYTFVGSILPGSTRIEAQGVSVMFEAGEDYPAVNIKISISKNMVFAACATETEFTDQSCATVRNIAEHLTDSICQSVAVLQGAWTVVTIDACLNADGSIRMRFSNASALLQEAFTKHGVTPQDIFMNNQHPDGFFLRLALDDINSGLTGQFMRSHFYHAVESLRRSVCPPSAEVNNVQSWQTFRDELGISREQIELLADHAERHADYRNAVPLTGSESRAVQEAIAQIIGSYIDWFKRKKLPTNSATKR